MWNRLKQQEATKTYEVRSGSLYIKKMGTLIRNMKEVCNSRVGKGINSLPSVKAHPGVFFSPTLFYASMRLFARPGCPVKKYIAIKKQEIELNLVAQSLGIPKR